MADLLVFWHRDLWRSPQWRDEGERRREEADQMTVAIMCEFASQVCLPQQRGVPERITHAELDTEYPPR